ncbi:MAG: CBS domain-containing protein [Oscillospiraceae bacterium]|nr:CBS domain-containing protein [Oscillospiraceae bacterium]
MNIFNLLTMKSQVAFLYDNITVKSALEDIHLNGYTAVPVINTAGEYVSTVTEGDFLRYMLNNDISGNKELMDTDKLCDIPIKREILPVRVTAALDDLLELAKTQNFVPVVDDRNIFIGIVTRKDLICYSCDRYTEIKKELAAK